MTLNGVMTADARYLCGIRASCNTCVGSVSSTGCTMKIMPQSTAKWMTDPTVYPALFFVTITTGSQGGPEKIAQSLMHRHSATICSRIRQFSPKCAKKMTVYESMSNLYQLVKYSLINS